MHDLSIFYGDGVPPLWTPDITGQFNGMTDVRPLGNYVFVIDDVLNQQGCSDLIVQFEHQNMYPVGVDGYMTGDDFVVGSYRTMGWSVSLARKMSDVFRLLPEIIQANQFPSPFRDDLEFRRLGATPWMRFMRYGNGGQHVPHYDNSYHCNEQSYRSLFSWVLYLNTVPRQHGGTFDFVDDGYRNHPLDRPKEAFQDWTRMADDEEVIFSINPRRGRMLIFPHWLCHQVSEYTGQDARYIIRGDLAYSYAEYPTRDK
jgi:hypothetical protein